MAETNNAADAGDALSQEQDALPDRQPPTPDPLSYKQRVAFKIGARARKFALEGCPIEGYDYLYGCLADAKATDPPLYAFLQIEAEKFDRRIAALEE